MTVGELIELLNEFPPELPVFFATDEAGRQAIAPVDAIMDLVHPSRGRVLDDDDPHGTVPPGYTDALVIHPRTVREPVEPGAT
jgi:hypothetical protein